MPAKGPNPAAAVEPIAKSTPDASKGAESALNRGGKTPETPAQAKAKSTPRKGGAAPLAGAYKRATSSSAKRIVLFGVLAAGAATALRDIKEGKAPSLRLGVGILFAGIFLSALADVIPEVAGPLGLLVLVGALVLPGQHGEPSVGADLIAAVRTIGK